MIFYKGILVAIFAFSVCFGQVYVNPNAPPPAPVKEVRPTIEASNNGFTTQTVYGFLDFTTTVGNTVMIFSPQSAPPPEPPTTTTTPKPIVNVIESKPTVQEVKSQEIKPSKTTKNTNVKISSIVQVVADPPVIKNSAKPVVLSSHVAIVTSEQKPSVTVLPQKKNVFSKVEVRQETPVIVQAVSTNYQKPLVQSTNVVNVPVFSSIVEVHANDPNDADAVLQIGNNIAEPEYDFLSRQPSEFAEETYRVINVKPTARSNNRNRQTQDHRRAQTSNARDNHPTGLVTKLGGTVIKDGLTTVHETSVIGTYISGKYAQVLQSSSHVCKNNNKQRIAPSSSLRILKTTAPTIPSGRHHIDPTPSHNTETAPLPGDQSGISGPNHVRSSRRPATASGSFKNRFRTRNNKDEIESDYQDPPSTPSNTPSRTTTTKKSPRSRNKLKNRRNRRKFSTANVELATVSVYSHKSTPSYSSRRNKGSRNGGHLKGTVTPAAAGTTTEPYSRRIFKPKIQPSAAAPAAVEPDTSTSLYKFKLNRQPGRWQYKTSPKPRVTIRKSNADDIIPVTPPSTNSDFITNDIPSVNSHSDDADLESSGSVSGDVLNDADTSENVLGKKYAVETLNVEISTPAVFKDTYYEIATIKTPYTFQVGTVKNTRYITVTSTFEKSLEPEPTVAPNPTEPLTENILAPSTHIDKEHNLLDSSIATLPPLYMSSDAETPPLETLTETFSTTQEMLKTHILPVIRDGANATSYTLIQTYHITRLVTATKTLPPMDAYQFVPSKRLKEFNTKLDEAGSELHLELDFGDDNDNDEDDEEPVRQLPADLDLANIGSDFDIFDVERRPVPHSKPKKKVQKVVTEVPPSQNLSPEQLQQLALLRLLNPGAAPQVITTSKPIIKLETVYESHVIPIINGASTSYSTISRSIGTISKTEFEIGTSMVNALPLQQLQPINPYQQQPQFQITTAPIITQTVVTQTQSKILKLTFGAKTAYTTLFSTNVVPTVLTTYVTTSIPVQQTAAFPGFYPPPYAPYPFVG